jgi:hypothetical protein
MRQPSRPAFKRRAQDPRCFFPPAISRQQTAEKKYISPLPLPRQIGINRGFKEVMAQSQGSADIRRHRLPPRLGLHRRPKAGLGLALHNQAVDLPEVKQAPIQVTRAEQRRCGSAEVGNGIVCRQISVTPGQLRRKHGL